MIQQVNLLRPEFAPRKILFGWRSLLLMAGVAVVAMGGITGLGHWQVQQLRHQAGTVKQQLGDLRAGMARITRSLALSEGDPHRIAARDRLRQRNVEAQQFLSALNRLSRTEGASFSAYFRGLARQPVAGLWLEELRIESGGESLSLRGQAVEARVIPKFLQVLRAEEAFTGHTFAEVEFERQSLEDPRQTISFEFRSSTESRAGGRDG
jgi:hypothetical protein